MKLTDKQKEELADARETLNELSKMLTDRISDLHEVKGGMQARHAYSYYRAKAWKAEYILRDILNK